jgi:hypothetical protein
MIKLRRYEKVDTRLSHLCTFSVAGQPVVIGSGYCKRVCPYCKGTLSILGIRFVKCHRP